MHTKCINILIEPSFLKSVVDLNLPMKALATYENDNKVRTVSHRKYS